MKAEQLLHAAIHALSPSALTEAFVGDGGSAGQITREAVHLPVEGELSSFDGAVAWLNSPPLTPAGLRGKVVLVDFWTYTCINWLRTLPYVRAWDEKYKDHGLVVIGVHTPEFSFEHEVDNVRRAAREMQVGYPIAVDSDYAVWNAFENNYWPAIYLADADGQIRYHQFGEGNYDKSEMAIQYLLTLAGYSGVGSDLVSVDPQGLEVAADWDDQESPETYVGYARGDNFASPGGAVWDRRQVYEIPSHLRRNEWALAGDWTVGEEIAVSNAANGRLAFKFHARDLHLVLTPPAGGGSARFRVSLDGQAPVDAHGFDVDEQGNGSVTEPRLHQLIRQRQVTGDRQFEIELLDPGAGAVVFTFG